jgi:origin recognition complex subunit 5
VQAVLCALGVPHAIVPSAECITGRHLLIKVLLGTLDALGLRDELERFGRGKCEHVSTLVVLLADAFAATTGKAIKKFVLVLDGIDKQREAPPALLLALARLGEVVCFCQYFCPSVFPTKITGYRLTMLTLLRYHLCLWS